MPERCEQREEIRWRPNRVVDGDLLMYLRAARSIAAFAGMCGGTAEDRCEAEAMDDTTVNALDTLHKHNYDTSKSLQALVKGPSVMYKEKKWSEEDIKRFAKGIRHLGKNFFKIRKEHLPHKDTCDLVEFYYFWKKSPAANNSRPQYRRHRRPLNKRQRPRNNQPDNEASSGSESEEESEESDGSRDVASCQRCFTTNSKDWHSGKDGEVLCSKCSVSFKKNGEESGVESPPPSSSPRQRLFKPVPEDEETTSSKHNMRTRRSNNTASTNGKQKERNSVSSPDLESTPAIASCSSTSTIISTTTSTPSSKNSRKSPSSLPDRDSRKLAQKSEKSGQAKKRRTATEDDSKLAKKKKEPSDSESGTESSSVSGTEDLGNEADSDDNIQEDLSSSSRLSSPSSEERGFKPLQPHPLTPGAHPATPTPGTTINITSSSQDTTVSSPVLSGPSSVPIQPLTTVKVLSGQPLSVSQASQQLTTQTVLPPSASSVSLAASPPLLSLSVTSNSSSLHLRLPQHSSPIPVLKPSFGLPGHISGVGSKAGSSSTNLVSNSCNLQSPLVIPTPSRASSTGTFIPHTELPLPVNTVGIPANINSPVTAVAKTSGALSSVDPFVSSAVSSSSSSIRLPLGGQINNTTSSAILSASSTNFGCKMQDQSEEQDKKPIVPQPGSFLTPPGGVGVPFAPYHSFYYPHGGPTHISHFHPSVGMSVPSTAGGNPPPPVPSLVPIKKEPHSPPPPLKSTDKATDLSSSSTASSHPLHRSHSENPNKLPHGFSQAGLAATAPPPLTVIEHRDGSRSELSKPDVYSKDSARAHSSSPLRSDNHLAPGLHRESRLDSNLSVLRESREIGLVGGATTCQPGQQLPLLSSVKEEPRTLQAAFQPYSHHPSPSSSSSSSSLTSHHPPSSVLQVPQLNLSSDQPGLCPQSIISQSMMAESSLAPSRPVPSLDIDSVKIEQNVDDEIDIEDEDEDSQGGSTTPGPTPQVCNREVYKSNSAIFVKVFDRGDRNQCSRTDFIFRPLPDSNLAKKREDRVRKSSHSSSSSSIKEEKKRVETPPRATSASEGQKSSSGSSSSSNSSSNHPHHSMGIGSGYAERHTPRSFADMPALRQLHEYARPHVYAAASLDDISLLRFTGQDLTRPPYSLGALQHHPHMDPLMGYRLGGMYPPGSRERLEMELERDKRERDAREREMRERELRDLELREKMKQDMELKPGLERLLPPGAASQLTDPSWLDLQRRMGFPPGAGGHLLPHGAPSVSAAGAHLPGVYPPVSLASDLLARERDKLDRLGLAGYLPQFSADMSYANAVERLSQERQIAERERDRERFAALANDQVARLQLAGAAAAATQHAHTHTHAHSHTHLHLHQQEMAHAQAVAHAQAHGLAPPAFPHALMAHAPHMYLHHPLAGAPGADPLASGPIGSLPASSTNSLSILPPGMAHHPLFAAAGTREELLQRELYSRGGPFLDPGLAHQLSAQAAAHEALQRHMAMERERFGSSGHLPH